MGLSEPPDISILVSGTPQWYVGNDSGVIEVLISIK